MSILVVWESPLQRKPLVIFNIITFHAFECPSLPPSRECTRCCCKWTSPPYNVNFWSFWIPITLWSIRVFFFNPMIQAVLCLLASCDTSKALGMNVFMASSSVKKVAGTCSKYDLFMTSIAIVLVTTSTCEMFHMPKCRKFWEHTHTQKHTHIHTQLGRWQHKWIVAFFF